jgi:hypothetical protein
MKSATTSTTRTNFHYQCRDCDLVIDSLFEEIGQSKSFFHMIETFHVIDRYEYEIGSPDYSENEYDNDFMQG